MAERWISRPPVRHPNYKPVPLRRPFLAALFLYACALVALLEYGFHTLPVVQDRISGFRPQRLRAATTPFARTTQPAPVSTGTRRRRNLATLPEQVSATPTSGMTSSSANTLATPTRSGNDASVTADGSAGLRPTVTLTRGPTTVPSQEPYVRPTSFPAWVYQRPNHLSWDWLNQKTAGRVLIANRQEEDRYGMLGPDYVLAHYVLAFEWTHGPSNMLKTPVPPGTDVSDRCVKHNIMGWVTNDTNDCPVLIPLNVWNSGEFSGAFGPIGNGQAFLDMDCRNYDNDQVTLLDPYWDEPDCWASEVVSRTIYHLSKTAGRDEVITATTTRIVTGHNGPLTFVELTTLGSDVATVTFDSSRVITTTRARGDTNPAPGILTTLTDPLGRPTATVTSFPFGFTQHIIPITLRDSSGRATATTFSPESLSSRLITLSNSHGTPTLTLTEYFRPRPTTPFFPSSPNPHRPPGNNPNPILLLYRPLSSPSYFAASFLPVILATVFTILTKILHSNIHSLLPFHALTRPGGSTGSDSLYLAPGGSIRALQTSWRLLTRFNEPISPLADLLFTLSAVLVWLSTEAVGVTLVGDCTVVDFYGCFLNLAVVKGPARAAEGVLICVAMLVAGMGVLLCRWETGVAASPWSVVGVASLLPRSCEEGETLRVLRGLDFVGVQKRKGDDGVRFKLGYDVSGEYCIVATTVDARLPQRGVTETDPQSPGSSVSNQQHKTNEPFGRRSPPWVLKLASRLGLLAVLCGFLTVIVVYETATTTDAFGQFMNGQNFGSGFLFTGVGLVVDFFWDEFFSWTSMLEPYRRLALRPQPPEASILMPRATTALTGIWQAVKLGNIFGGAVAVVSVLSKFTPIFLANIPFRLTLTWTMHRVCAWLSVAILTSMVLVLVGSFFIKWPDLPVEPSTIAGCMYYVCDSEMLKDFEGMSLMGQREREKRLGTQGRKYHLSEIIGVSGEARVGIDSATKVEV